MTRGITTWSELGRLDGNVLFIPNTDPGADPGGVLKALAAASSPAALYAIAEPGWQPHLRAAGFADDHILLTVDDEGKQLELNFFIATSTAATWVMSRPFAFVIGSSAHSLHNDEVKDVYEQSITLLLGEATFLAHTLPLPYIYRLDLADLVRRLDRDHVVNAYVRDTEALLKALHAEWVRLGKPERQDKEFDGSLAILRRQMPWLTAMREDEEAPAADLALHQAIGRMGASITGVIGRNAEARDARVREMKIAHGERVDQLIAAYEERKEAVIERDRIIDRLNQQSLRDHLLGWWRNRK